MVALQTFASIEIGIYEGSLLDPVPDLYALGRIIGSLRLRTTANEAAVLDKEDSMTPPPSPEAIRVMIVDRDRLVREGLRMLMQSNPSLQVVAEAENGTEALDIVGTAKPDVVMLALELGSESGVDVLPGLLSASPGSRVLIVTHVKDAEEHRKAMISGAMGVVQKDLGSEVVFKAIQKVYAGEIWFDRSKLGSVLRDIQRTNSGKKADPVAAKIASLTRREHEVIALISEGLKNREIGERLFISETTVRHHLTSVFEKLEVSNRLELIIFAFSHGLANVPGNGRPMANGPKKSPPTKVMMLSRTM